MANFEHLNVLKRGVRVWNDWRKENMDIRPDLSGADLNSADLAKADLSGADLSGADLSGADLSGADLTEADLTEADLHRADLTEADLTEADLFGADLALTIIIGSKLERVNLIRAKLIGTYFYESNLFEANISEADLSLSNFLETTLAGANLSKANLENASFIECELYKTSFDSCSLAKTIFGLTDLSTCLGLETIQHFGPSVIDGSTTILDYHNLPVKFLKGCGLKDWQIESIKLNDPGLNESQITDLVYEIDRLRNKSPIQPYSVFISYSRKDEVFVERIEEIFNKNGIRYWRDVHHATAGPLEKQISSAIHLNQTVLLVLSVQSVKSDWVQFEVRKAMELEQKLKRHVICPVAIDDSWKNCSWPERLRYQIEEYNILDFSKWGDNEAFKSQTAKLFKGLNIYYRDKSN